MKLTVLYGTETGNCRGLANKVAAKGQKNGVEVAVRDLATCKASDLEAIDHPMLFIISTWDDGDPPPKCVPFCNDLKSTAPSISGSKYTVLALGDTEYPLFCECGKQIDSRLAALGAEPYMPREELGADFMVSYIGWSKRFWKTMAGVYGLTA